MGGLGVVRADDELSSRQGSFIPWAVVRLIRKLWMQKGEEDSEVAKSTGVRVGLVDGDGRCFELN